ncbi:MAG: ABC transporter ATP-binding protein [Bacteroidaceae bacterium]|nr:ABC transporter ATP-binding protein [Bacteroidaceae bacterium]
MLQLENITKRYTDGQRQLTVLDGLCLHVDEGDFIAITGESGAGKTTLLSILGTLMPADEGRYVLEVSGERLEVMQCSWDRICRLRNQAIGFVYQDHRLLPQFTVMQNILLPTLATKKTSTEEEQQHAMALLQFMGILTLKDSPVTQLSGGEQARVAICRALINRPAILLADEPTGQLDASNAQTIASLFQQVNTQLHTTIIMATHSDQMAKVAQKIYQLKNGTLALRL